jgi:hypothetical protein
MLIEAAGKISRVAYVEVVVFEGEQDVDAEGERVCGFLMRLSCGFV